MIPKPLQILLVDDDYGDAKAMVRSVHQYNPNIKIVRAEDGVEALSILEGTHQEKTISDPFISFIDLNMPRMNGLELLTEIRRRAKTRNTIIYILTTSDRPEDLKEAYKHQIAGYLVKGSQPDFYQKLSTLVSIYSEIIRFKKS